jgi:hypothetical protein
MLREEFCVCTMQAERRITLAHRTDGVRLAYLRHLAFSAIVLHPVHWQVIVLSSAAVGCVSQKLYSTAPHGW